MEAAAALATYLEIIDAEMPGFLEGLYVVGSYALGDWNERHSDIDIIAVTAEPAADAEAGVLRTVHALLAERQPAPHIDGPYVAWGDLPVAPATGLHRPWTLDGRLHHDGECFEINPVTWHTLAAYGVTVRGPAAETLDVWLSVEDRVRFVLGNLASYWSDVAASLAQAPDDRRFDGESLQWCALGALRLHHTAFTGDVISKTGAAGYGLETAPARFHDTLRLAAELRAGATAVDGVDAATMKNAGELIEWVCDDAASASH
jgi:hypothetical protein